MFYTYVLKSIGNNKFYIGYTNNLSDRLYEHNAGKSIYTNRYKPWEVVYFEEFGNKEEAILREKYFKTHAGREWLKKNASK